MNITKEFIELQGFRFETNTPEGLQIFTIRNQDRIYDLMVNHEDNTMTVDLYENDEEDPTCLYDGKLLNTIQFCGFLRHHKEITNDSISLPLDFVHKFMNDTYDYNQNDFDSMCDVSLLLLLSKEDYETCTPFMEFRKNYYKKKDWIYKDIPQESFRDYSKITSRTS